MNYKVAANTNSRLINTHPVNSKVKECTKCKNVFPETRDHFGQFKNKTKAGTRIGFRGACRKCVAAHTNNYDKKKPGKAKQRRDRRAKAVHSLKGNAPRDLPKLRKILNDQCRFCSNPLNGSGHIDHLTPIARGGSHSQSNLTICCDKCNLAKGGKTRSEFIAWRKERELNIRSINISGEKPDVPSHHQIRRTYN